MKIKYESGLTREVTCDVSGVQGRKYGRDRGERYPVERRFEETFQRVGTQEGVESRVSQSWTEEVMEEGLQCLYTDPE